jgi:hypothetical protein
VVDVGNNGKITNVLHQGLRKDNRKAGSQDSHREEESAATTKRGTCCVPLEMDGAGAGLRKSGACYSRTPHFSEFS